MSMLPVRLDVCVFLCDVFLQYLWYALVDLLVDFHQTFVSSAY